MRPKATSNIHPTWLSLSVSRPQRPPPQVHSRACFGAVHYQTRCCPLLCVRGLYWSTTRFLVGAPTFAVLVGTRRLEIFLYRGKTGLIFATTTKNTIHFTYEGPPRPYRLKYKFTQSIRIWRTSMISPSTRCSMNGSRCNGSGSPGLSSVTAAR